MIMIKNKAGTFVDATADCDGTNSAIFLARQCAVPFATFGTTYLLVQGDELIAKIKV